MRPNGKNEGSIVVIAKESSKSSSCDDGEEHKEQVQDHLVIIKEVIKISIENYNHIEKFNKNGRYCKRERRPFGEGDELHSTSTWLK